MLIRAKRGSREAMSGRQEREVTKRDRKVALGRAMQQDIPSRRSTSEVVVADMLVAKRKRGTSKELGEQGERESLRN